MKQSSLGLLCVISLGIFAGCASTSPFGDDGHLNCVTVSQLESIPRCMATVERITPCSVHLKTDAGHSLALAGPGGADRAILSFMDALKKGHTYAFPDAFIEYQKAQDRPNRVASVTAASSTVSRIAAGPPLKERTEKFAMDEMWRLSDDSDPKVRAALAARPALPNAVMETLAKDADARVRAGVARRGDAPLAVLTALAGDASRDVRLCVMQNPATPVAVRVRLIADIGDSGLRARTAAKCEKIPPNVALLFAKDRERAVREALAENPAAPHDALVLLCRDDEVRVRRRAYGNSGMSDRVRRTFAKDPDLGLRIHVARHRRTPPEALVLLAVDPSSEVSSAALANPNTPPEAMVRHARMLGNRGYIFLWRVTRPDWLREAARHKDLRRYLIRNGNAPVDVLIALAADSDPKIRKEFMAALKGDLPAQCIRFLVKDAPEDMRIAIARCLSTPEDVLIALARDPCTEVRRCVSFHAGTPPRVLRFLAKDAERQVRRPVAEHPSTPVDVMRDLAADGLLFGVVLNIRAPTDVLAGMATSSDISLRRHVAANAYSSPEVLKLLAADRYVDVRQSAAANPATPNETIQELSTDKHWRVRQAVAQNPRASDKLLKTLIADPEEQVRMTATFRLERRDKEQLGDRDTADQPSEELKPASESSDAENDANPKD